jgi:hypothetical protein
MNETFSDLYNAIIAGDAPGAKAGVQKALDADNEPGLILSDGMIAP